MLSRKEVDIRELVRSMELPQGEIFFLHVRLRGLHPSLDYAMQTRRLLTALQDCYAPLTMLIPTFTYSFTETGKYDRVHSPSETGRFGEEVRRLHAAALRTMNPVFSCVDTMGYFSLGEIDESSAFGKGSLLERLAAHEYVIVNIHLPEFISTHLHYLEYLRRVDYRFEKSFFGQISEDGERFTPMEYAYYVRRLDRDTRWRREKIEASLRKAGAMRRIERGGVITRWVRSEDMDRLIGGALKRDPDFLITD